MRAPIRRRAVWLASLAAAAILSAPPMAAPPGPFGPGARAVGPGARDPGESPAPAARAARSRGARIDRPRPERPNPTEPPPEAAPTASQTVGITVQVLPAPPPRRYEFGLGQNYPNPFTRTTTIWYSLGYATHVSIVVYSVLGQRVATLVDRHGEAGFHTVQWDGRGAAGRRLPPGVYLYRARAGPFEKTLKLVLD